ncbi:hypothetical protein B0T09DRAFT_173517 [Sordaria sp. MPI-SDFR-AT-0083]|nr:hypothetical protein B0T09DRAFT_173517 [Sordaria sp. MPI-SDFR-AT-0083]
MPLPLLAVFCFAGISKPFFLHGVHSTPKVNYGATPDPTFVAGEGEGSLLPPRTLLNQNFRSTSQNMTLLTRHLLASIFSGMNCKYVGPRERSIGKGKIHLQKRGD